MNKKEGCQYAHVTISKNEFRLSRMRQFLTQLMETYLTTSLDQEKSVPVVKDEVWRQMVSRGRLLP